MGWLGKVLGFFTGNSGGKVIDMADKAFHTEQEKVETDQKDLDSARGMQLFSHGTWLDVVVDGVSRLIRPGVTVWLVGSFMGFWKLPDPGLVDPYWQNVFMLVLTFWFGGRALLKDLPAAVRAMRGR